MKEENIAHGNRNKELRLEISFLPDIAKIYFKCDGFFHPNDGGGMAWNDPEIGIKWLGIVGVYSGSASAEGYSFDGVPLNLSEKDQKWKGIKETFKF